MVTRSGRSSWKGARNGSTDQCSRQVSTDLVSEHSLCYNLSDMVLGRDKVVKTD
jgi:hypothetical protein